MRLMRGGSVALAIAILLAGCGSPSTSGGSSASSAAPSAQASAASSASSKASYTLTLSGDHTGVFASSGLANTNGFEAYIASVNAKGGVDGHHIDMQVLDDRSDVPTALANYQLALNSSSLGFLQNNASPVIQAVAPKATKDGIVESSSGGYNGGNGVYPYIFNENPTVPTYMDEIVPFALAKVPNPQGAKVAFLAYDSALTETYEPMLAKALGPKGFSIAYNQLVPIKAVDMSVAAGNIAGLSPAMVVTAMQDAQIVPLVTGLRQRGYKGPVINFNSNVTAVSLKKLNDPQMYLIQYTADPTDSKNPDVAAMDQVAKETGFTQEMDQLFFIEAYVFGKVVVAALGKCGDNCTRQTFNTALENTTVSAGTLMAGSPGFTPTDHVMTKKLVVDQWSTSSGALAPIPGFGF